MSSAAAKPEITPIKTVMVANRGKLVESVTKVTALYNHFHYV